AFACVKAPPYRKGRLTVSRAVFLPLSKPVVETDWDDDSDVHLLVHGYYFLDAGRRSVHTSETDKLGEWNARLERRGTLPLLPLALRGFSGIAGFSDDTI